MLIRTVQDSFQMFKIREGIKDEGITTAMKRGSNIRTFEKSTKNNDWRSADWHDDIYEFTNFWALCNA
ncbi:hypothetical protein chiPu_0018234 [Chiloscyllium punctatum]|uniref:Uncharacterized protein n=1 Tax=Chiloscyllium punctatum TaxID=137246 RepID=A0A401RLT4_CHIPU|nr:hypothetical protein [Chiloscyllium punctatum]